MFDDYIRQKYRVGVVLAGTNSIAIPPKTRSKFLISN